MCRKYLKGVSFISHTYELSDASISSTDSHAKRASLDVGPNFLLAAMASSMAALVSTRAFWSEETTERLLAPPWTKADAPVEQAATVAVAARRVLDNFIVVNMI